MEYQTIEQNDLQLPSKPTLTDFQQYVKKMKTIRNFNVTDPFYECCLFMEECGEVVSAIRKNSKGGTIGTGSKKGNIEEELADVFMYVCSLANMFDVDLEKAFRQKEEINKTRFWKKI
jgi:NTP pyrophosphatase (non-canonical NTP hydrolase)